MILHLNQRGTFQTVSVTGKRFAAYHRMEELLFSFIFFNGKKTQNDPCFHSKAMPHLQERQPLHSITFRQNGAPSQIDDSVTTTLGLTFVENSALDRFFAQVTSDV